MNHERVELEREDPCANGHRGPFETILRDDTDGMDERCLACGRISEGGEERKLADGRDTEMF